MVFYKIGAKNRSQIEIFHNQLTKPASAHLASGQERPKHNPNNVTKKALVTSIISQFEWLPIGYIIISDNSLLVMGSLKDTVIASISNPTNKCVQIGAILSELELIN